MKKLKICEKCGSSFEQLMMINGEFKNLQNRKYCLNCSPFGKHNTVNLLIENPGNALTKGGKICPHCNVFLSSDDFYRRRKNTDLSVYCKICTNRHAIERFREIKKRSVEYKGGSCQMCGYNKCINALEFHHVDPTQKDFSISKSKGKTFDKIKPELDKCILVCANCHREIHFKSGKYADFD